MKKKSIKKAVDSTATVNDKQISLLRRGCVPDRSPEDSPTPSPDFIRLAPINLDLHVDKHNIK